VVQATFQLLRLFDDSWTCALFYQIGKVWVFYEQKKVHGFCSFIGVRYCSVLPRINHIRFRISLGRSVPATPLRSHLLSCSRSIGFDTVDTYPACTLLGRFVERRTFYLPTLLAARTILSPRSPLRRILPHAKTY
jgi:hypothetical protein